MTIDMSHRLVRHTVIGVELRVSLRSGCVVAYLFERGRGPVEIVPELSGEL